jgi:ribosomal protein S18 acetylase RimI-like enzyme
MTSVRIGTSLDLPFVEAMLYEAFYWDTEARRPPFIEARCRPEFSHLLAGWGRPGDVVLVAEHGQVAVGATWFRCWTREIHSYGFVDEETPELGIAVAPGLRGHGIGRALLRALIDAAARNDHPGISLSVAPANPARRLYESEGFGKVGEDGASWTMYRRLPTPTHR